MSELEPLRNALLRQFEDSNAASPLYTAVDGVILLKAKAERHPTYLVHKPAICMVIQGSKWTTFGARRLEYCAGQAMVVSVEMPGGSQVVEGDDLPYLSMVVEFDLAIMREVYEALATQPPLGAPKPAGAFVIDLDAQLLSCAVRILELLDRPQAAPILYPVLMRELCYWLLASPHGEALAQQVVGNDLNRKVVQSIRMLRERYNKNVPLKALADNAGLSPSAFHRHFKTLTDMTPLDFQKKIRMVEARRLMIAEDMSAENAAFEVGYASASQFSREYARMFGAPPRRDIEKLRGSSAHATDVQ